METNDMKVLRILSQYNELIKIQTIKSPSAVRGLEVSMIKWKKLLTKLDNNKKLTKDEVRMVKLLDAKIADMKKYLDLVK